MTEIESVRYIAQLEAAGFQQIPGSLWRLPSPEHEVTQDQMAAIRYLVAHNDCQGIESDAMWAGTTAFRSGVPLSSNPHSYTFDGGHPHDQWARGWLIEQDAAAIDKAASDYAANAWPRAMTNGKAAEDRFA